MCEGHEADGITRGDDFAQSETWRAGRAKDYIRVEDAGQPQMSDDGAWTKVVVLYKSEPVLPIDGMVKQGFKRAICSRRWIIFFCMNPQKINSKFNVIYRYLIWTMHSARNKLQVNWGRAAVLKVDTRERREPRNCVQSSISSQKQ